jgi:hypothetical protein
MPEALRGPGGLSRPATSVALADSSVDGDRLVAVSGSGGPVILLPAAALVLGSGILTYAILGRR